MNKAELVDIMAEAADISKAAALRSLDAFIETVSKSLREGDSVALIGFGTFEVGNRKQRIGRNPRTGEEITIPAAKVPRFKAGKKLKDEVNR